MLRFGIRLVRAVALATMLLPLATVPMSTPAQASPSPLAAAAQNGSESVSSKFSITRLWYAPPLKRCVRIDLTGTIKATHHTVVRPQQHRMAAPRILAPRMGISVFNNCSMSKVAKVSKIKLTQRYYDTKCKVAPSFGADAGSGGFSIGVSATLNCGSVSNGRRTSTYSKRSSHYAQNSSSLHLVWKDKTSGWQPASKFAQVCIGGDVEVQAFRPRTVDDYFKTKYQACVGHSY